jgi:hypothetical protein
LGITVVKNIQNLKHLPALKKTAGVIALCFLQMIGCAQKSNDVILDIKAVYDGRELVLDSNYLSREGAELKFEAFRFYISNLRFAMNDSVTWQEKDSYHLYDQSARNSFKLRVPANIRFNTLKFDLGIDSLTNVSGAMGGDLDPTKGMYWTWQSGYINFKLEGKSHQCQNPKREFQYHLGGYQKPFDALQAVSLKTASKDVVMIRFDVKQFMEFADLAKEDHIMSPGAGAVKLSIAASFCFSSDKP